MNLKELFYFLVKFYPFIFCFYVIPVILYYIILTFAICPLLYSLKYGAISYWDISPFAYMFGSVSGSNILLAVAVVVSIISYLIHVYAYAYLGADPQLDRFLVTFFVFFLSMFAFIVSLNLLTIFIAWELLGLSSFFLIKFWSNRPLATRSAMKALIINRFGDFFLILMISVSYTSFHLVDLEPMYVVVSDTVFDFNMAFFSFECISLFSFLAILTALAACVKSAQIPFHTWLPDAMEGPTPVSSLLHAATMVTAGVILICKFSPLVNISIGAKDILLLAGG